MNTLALTSNPWYWAGIIFGFIVFVVVPVLFFYWRHKTATSKKCQQTQLEQQRTEEKKRIGTALRVAKSATLSNAVEALRIAGIYVVVERQQGVGPTKAKIILPELFWSMDDDYLMAKAISTIMNDATCSPSIMGDGLLTFLMENIHVRTIEVFRVFLELERVADQGLMRGLHQRLKDISPR